MASALRAIRFTASRFVVPSRPFGSRVRRWLTTSGAEVRGFFHGHRVQEVVDPWLDAAERGRGQRPPVAKGSSGGSCRRRPLASGMLQHRGFSGCIAGDRALGCRRADVVPICSRVRLAPCRWLALERFAQVFGLLLGSRSAKVRRLPSCLCLLRSRKARAAFRALTRASACCTTGPSRAGTSDHARPHWPAPTAWSPWAIGASAKGFACRRFPPVRARTSAVQRIGLCGAGSSYLTVTLTQLGLRPGSPGSGCGATVLAAGDSGPDGRSAFSDRSFLLPRSSFPGAQRAGRARDSMRHR